jgi:hypothetical protein
MSKKKRRYYFNPNSEKVRSKILESQRIKLLKSSQKKNNEMLFFIFIIIVFIFLMEN